MGSTSLYLPDECWELILKFLINHDDKKKNYSPEATSFSGYFQRFPYLPSDSHSISLSVVSKQFLSITNRLRFSLTIFNHAHPFPISLFHRFNNLTSLNLSCYYGDLNDLLCQISRFPLSLTSLNLSGQPEIPVDGLRSFSKNITTLTSLSCSRMDCINSSDLSLIADCFPLLEELDLSDPVWLHLADEREEYWNSVHNFNSGLETLSSSLFKLRKVNLSDHYYINDQSLFHLFKTCKLLEEAIISFEHLTMAGIDSALRESPNLRSLSFSNLVLSTPARIGHSLLSLKGLTGLDLLSFKISDEFLSSIAMEGLPLTRLVLKNCTGYSYDGISNLLSKCQHLQHLNLQNADFLNDQHVVQLSSFLGNLMSINLSRCCNLTKSVLFALAQNYPSLSEIIMEYTNIRKISEENSNSSTDVVVSPQLKSLCLACNLWLREENITMITSIFPNLELLDLSHCNKISEESICQVLRRCRNIRYLNLANCSRVKFIRVNFKVPKLEVLDLSFTKVGDETLYFISKNCCGLLQLFLSNCYALTKKGVEHVVKNCTQLREFNLNGCDKVNADIVAFMVFSRPSLRKIEVAHRFRPNDEKREYFLRHGCLVN
ncbi:F-box/LRR-repeat protein 2-like [Trifolium pratense]|uniref:F-box/LRR-repeat protein 2-like n=1 Tax=Trifolium pratense TaxID=57577 RepID=UPI001E693F0A|nr:F-box/LRR-repeat protein 2-like [Trifolium pratense]